MYGIRISRKPPTCRTLGGAATESSGLSRQGGCLLRIRGAGRSTELTVLAAATIVAAVGAMFAVMVFLAGDTQTHAGHGFAPRLGDGFVAFFAMGETGSAAHLAAHALDRILYGRVDLVVDGVVAGPAGGHVVLRRLEMP